MIPARESQGWASNLADEVQDVLGQTWEDWWNPQSGVNMCVVTLNTASGPRQFLYCVTSHKYSDGGAGASLVHAVVEGHDPHCRASFVNAT